MKNSLTFLKASALNINELAEGMSELHFAVHKQRRSPDYWRWRYFNGPGGRSNLIVAVRGSRVVGVYGLIYLPLVVNSKSVIAGLMEGVFIQPSERSWQCYRGLVETSIRESQKDSLSFRFGISPSHRMKLYQRVGVISLGLVPISIGFLNMARILEGRSVPYPLSLAGLLLQPVIGLKSKSKESVSVDIRPVESFDSTFDDLWRSIANRRSVTVIKNAAYLNWRYTECLGRQYGRLAAYQGKRLEGVVVFGANGLRQSGFIFELLVRDGNPEIIKGLLLYTFRELRKKNIGHITASFPVGSPEADILKGLGFKSWGTKLWSTHLIIASNSPRGGCPELGLKSWDFSFGDWGKY